MSSSFPNRLARSPDDNEFFERGVLRLCEDIHMGLNRSSDESFQSVQDKVAYLKHRLEAWSPSTSDSELYDALVHILIHQVLNEFHVFCRKMEEKNG